MKTIIEHIEQLLCKHECVIVPSLGGFISHREGAKLLDNQLLAPKQQIRFNALMTYHDGLLAEAIMKERSMDYGSALSLIRHEVSSIKDRLHDGNEVQFGQIGVFSLCNSTELRFQCGSSKFLPANLGLPEVKLTKIIKTEQNKTSDKKKKTITIEIPNYSNNFIKYAASIAIIFLLSLFAPPTHQHSYKAAISFDAFAPTTEHKQEIIIEEETTTNEEEIEIPEKEEEPVIIEDYNYHIIIASFPNKTSAEKYINKHTNNTLPLSIIDKSNKFRISEQGFNKYNDALNYLNSIKKERSAWILCI